MSNELKEKRDYINRLSNEIKGREQSLAYIKMDFKKAKNEYFEYFIKENKDSFPFKSGNFITIGNNKEMILLKILDVKFNIDIEKDNLDKNYPIVFTCLEFILFNTGAKIRHLYKNFCSFLYIFDSWEEMMHIHNFSIVSEKNNITKILDLCYEKLNNINGHGLDVLEFDHTGRVISMTDKLFNIKNELEDLYKKHLGIEYKW